jgi:RNA polymerase sigma factor (sigma-70 family)
MIAARAGCASMAQAGAGMTREEQFLAHLPLIERVIAWVSSRRGLRGTDAEDFASGVKTRLIEHDYDVLAKFAGRSSLRTYLTAVINRMYLDFQIQRFGKWRPSAEARRLGPLAVRLERLVHRDGLLHDEAIECLLSDSRVSATRDELLQLAARLPRRPSRRPSAVPPEVSEPPDTVDDALERAERQALADRVFCAIRRALAELPAEERLFLRLHYEGGLNVAEVSRALGREQKPLYIEKGGLLRRLRSRLEAEGIGPSDVQELLGTLDWEAALESDSPREAADEESAEGASGKIP